VLAGAIASLTVTLLGLGLRLYSALRTLQGPSPQDRAFWRARVGAAASAEEDYAGLEETAYLLSNTANAAHLLGSIEQLERGEGKVRDLIEG
jgi:hypothetical protein